MCDVNLRYVSDVVGSGRTTGQNTRKPISCPNHNEFMSRVKRAKRCYKPRKERRDARLVMSEQQRIRICKTSVEQIYGMLRSTPSDWRHYTGLARTVIEHLDLTTFMQQPENKAETTWMISGLQQLAASDTDRENTADIALWCSHQWLAIIERDPQSVEALRGIGLTWLARAQPILARIHRTENSSSSSGGSSQPSTTSPSVHDEERQDAAATAEAERRSGLADYVEVRGYLQPATEYLDRAVAAARQQGCLTGESLASTAEAYMSLANASSPRVSERHFRRALQLLRAAADIPGYSLSRYLQQYLDDYGRLCD